MTVVPGPPPLDPPAITRRTPRAVLRLAGAFVVLTLATRAPGLGRPDILVFDELYYALQARDIATGGVERGHTVHPPLATWMIAAGVRVLGFDPVGWRIVPLVAGALLVALTVLAAGRLTASCAAAAVAGLVVLTDGLAFTTGRLALLDGLLALFTTVAAGAMLASAGRPLDDALRRRATIVTAGALGAGLACKWSAAALLPVALILFCGLVTGTWPPGPVRRRLLGRTVFTLLVLPAAVYATTYVPTVIAFDSSGVRREVCGGEPACATSLIDRLAAIATDHRHVLEFHRELEPQNRFAASGLTWVAQTRPTGMLLTVCDGTADPVCQGAADGTARRIIAVGNPIVWVLGTGAVLLTAGRALRRRSAVDGTLAACVAALWLPWMIGGRAGYAFYGVTVIPLLAIALARVGSDLPVRVRRPAAVALAVIAIAGFVVLVPVWTGRPTSPGYPFGWFDSL